MAKLHTALIGLGLGCSLLAQEAIVAVKVNEKLAGITPDSKVWNIAYPSMNKAYPQTTIRFNDKKVGELNGASLAQDIQVRALYNDSEIAFKIRWADATESMLDFESDSYGDGFAVQFPREYADVTKLPYIGMGSEGREVVVHLSKYSKPLYEPDGKGDVAHQVALQNRPYFDDEATKFSQDVAKLGESYDRSFIAKGFRSTTEIQDSDFKSSMNYDKTNKIWTVTLTRSLKDGYLDLTKGGGFPIAIALWDGDKANRDGSKKLTSWLPVRFPTINGSQELAEEILSKEAGDVAKGKQVAMENCAACHRFQEADFAPEYMAPTLSNIGGYATRAYIKESIIDPNAVIVPGYNRRAHSAYAWYNLDENNQRVSTMPPYNWLDENSINDLVAFLQTLKEER